MRLLLFLLLSISNGNNQSTGDVGVTVERQSLKERTRDGRSVIAFLKPWVLELINSRARDDRTYKYGRVIDSGQACCTVGPLTNQRPNYSC